MDKLVIEIPCVGDISDGYHTFDELYWHRCILFATICNANKNIAWKSKKHHDETMFGDDYFIVGIDTPKGQYTYHYNLCYWYLFDVEELDYAPVWDGHKPSDVLRMLSLIPSKQLVKTNDVLRHDKNRYQVIIADDNVFVLGQLIYDNIKGCDTLSDDLKMYKNQTHINTLESLGMVLGGNADD